MAKRSRLSIATGSLLLIAMLVVTLLARLAAAEDWPQWRGPHFDGHGDDAGYPDTLAKDKNLLWSATLPGTGAGTPIVFGDRVFVSALSPEKDLLALCYARKDGKLCWQAKVGLNVLTNKLNDQASPSPLTDGKSVFFYFGTGDLAAFDFDGKPIWSRNIQRDHGTFNVQWIYASTPLLFDGKLYVQVLQRDVPPVRGPVPEGTPKSDSYLLCIDPATGKDLWKHVRPTDALVESHEAYSTPTPVQTDAGAQIVIMGGDYMTGHDPATGRELWRSPSYNPGKDKFWRTVPSAVAGGGLLFSSAPKNGVLFAVRPGSGSVPFAWQSDAQGPAALRTDVCVPLFYKGMLYVLKGEKPFSLSCVVPATGQTKWRLDLPGTKVFRASPTGVDDKIYFTNEGGDAFVASATEPKLLYKTSLGSPVPARATIAASAGQLFVRTADTLYVFGRE